MITPTEALVMLGSMLLPIVLLVALGYALVTLTGLRRRLARLEQEVAELRRLS